MVTLSGYRITLCILGGFAAVLIFSMPWSADAAITSNLTVGSSGSQVQELQQTLTNLGYFNHTVTGYFGSITKAAVIKFQTSNDISPAVGYFGPLTRAKLNSGASTPGGAIAGASNPAPPEITSPAGTTNLPASVTQVAPSSASTPFSIVLVVPGMDLSRTLFPTNLSLPQSDSDIADNLRSFFGPQKTSNVQITTFTDWNRDIKDTENAVNELKNEILILNAVAQSSNPKATFNIVAHSWGGVLTYAALMELTGKVHVDNLFTLGSPIGNLANPALFPKDQSLCPSQAGLFDISGILCPHIPNSIRGKTIEGRPEGVDQWINFWSRGDMFSYEVAFSKPSSKKVNYQYNPSALPQSPPLYCGMLGGILFNNQLPECHKFVQSVQDAHKEYYDWTNVNTAISDVAKEVLGKIDKILKGSNLPNIPVFQTLNVSLSASQSSITAGQSVSLTANVSGTAQGTIHYQFDCTNNGGYEVDVVNNTDPYTTSSCSYSSPGTYTAKVHVERGTAAPTEAIIRIVVTSPVVSTPSMSGTTIKVISPNGGEQWVIGKTYNINWSTDAGTIDSIILWRENPNPDLHRIYTQNIPVNVGANGFYSWTIPSTLTPGSYQISVVIPSSIPPTNYDVGDDTTLSETILPADSSDDWFSIVSSYPIPVPVPTLTPAPTGSSGGGGGGSIGSGNIPQTQPQTQQTPQFQQQTLVVSILVNPLNGTAPLNNVSVKASVFGTAQGTVNYTFYCNRSDSGTNITSDWNAKFDGIPDKSKTAVCNYPNPGTYTIKVIAEQGSAPPAEVRMPINVASSLPASISTPPPSSSLQPSLSPQPANPIVSLWPTSGSKGSLFTFAGSGFTPSGGITEVIFKPDGTNYPSNHYKANANGSYTKTYNSSTATMFGAYIITWFDDVTGHQSNQVKETITTQ